MDKDFEAEVLYLGKYVKEEENCITSLQLRDVISERVPKYASHVGVSALLELYQRCLYAVFGFYSLKGDRKGSNGDTIRNPSICLSREI
jgi:hypothetical protein